MPVTRGLPRVLSHRWRTSSSFRGGKAVEVEIEPNSACFRDDDATSVMTHVDVGIVTIISHWWRRDIVVVVCVIIHTPGVIIHTRVHDHVTSHNS